MDMKWKPPASLKPAPWPTRLSLLSGLAFLYGYPYRMMVPNSPSWLLFGDILFVMVGLGHWNQVLAARLSKLEAKLATLDQLEDFATGKPL